MGRAAVDDRRADEAGDLGAAASLRALALPVLVVVANVVLLYGFRVPHSNEYVYLLRLRAVHDPSFLAGDWTFSRSFSEHFLFNAVFSPLTGVFSTEVLGWVGRFACWIVLAALLLRFGIALGLSRWTAAVALIVWLPCQLRLVGADWVFGGFEAKPLAYIALFTALLLAFRRRTPWALAAAGLAFSLHPGVGVWASVPLVIALLWWEPTRRETLRWWWVAALLAAPGAVSTLTGLGSTSAPREVWTFVVDQAHPFHLDPFYFGVLNVVLLAGMLVFNIAWGRVRPRPAGFDDLLLRLQSVMAVPVVAGIAIYLAGRDELLKYYPFRVFPVLVSLLFIFNLADAWKQRHQLLRRDDMFRSIGTWAIVAAVATLVIWNPPKLYASEARLVFRDWQSDEGAREHVLRWVSDNVPRDAVVVMPPGPEDTYYLGERSQVVNQKALSFDEIAAWHERLQRLAPGVFGVGVLEDDAELADLYASLDEEEVLDLRDEYAASFIVTEADYGFPVVHREGDWTVYEIPSGN